MKRALVWAYLALAIVGAAVSVVGDHAGRPLGIDLGLSPAAGIALGWGAALSAPWPLLVAFVGAEAMRRGPTWLVPMLAVVFVTGILVEPIFWSALRGAEGFGVAAIASLDLVVPLGLLFVQWRSHVRNDVVTPV